MSNTAALQVASSSDLDEDTESCRQCRWLAQAAVLAVRTCDMLFGVDSMSRIIHPIPCIHHRQVNNGLVDRHLGSFLTTKRVEICCFDTLNDAGKGCCQLSVQLGKEWGKGVSDQVVAGIGMRKTDEIVARAWCGMKTRIVVSRRGSPQDVAYLAESVSWRAQQWCVCVCVCSVYVFNSRNGEKERRREICPDEERKEADGERGKRRR